MRNRFIILFLIILLSACAAYTEKKNWEVVDRHCPAHTFTCSSQEWKKAGYKADEAISWVNAGVITTETANEWKQLGFSLEDAKLWIEKHITTPNIARALKDAGFTPLEATQWFSVKIGLVGSVKFKNAGMDLPEAKEWSNLMHTVSGFGNFDTVLGWRSLGFTASQAKQWSFFQSPEEAKEWRDTELGFRLSKGYKVYGIPPSLAVAYRDILNKECPKGKVVDWYEENAFDVKDKCFTYDGDQRSIIERTKAIYHETGNSMFERFFGGTRGVSNNLPALIDFSSENAPKHFTGFVKSIGVTNYEVEFGGKRIIPIFQPIVQFPR